MQVSTYTFHNNSINRSQDIPNKEKSCYQCGTSDSPEWRVGPKKTTLCNKHGLRISRLRDNCPQVKTLLEQVAAHPELYAIEDIFKRIYLIEQEQGPCKSKPKKRKNSKAPATFDQLTLKITKISKTTVKQIVHLHFHQETGIPKTAQKPFSLNGKIPVESLLN